MNSENEFFGECVCQHGNLWSLALMCFQARCSLDLLAVPHSHPSEERDCFVGTFFCTGAFAARSHLEAPDGLKARRTQFSSTSASPSPFLFPCPTPSSSPSTTFDLSLSNFLSLSLSLSLLFCLPLPLTLCPSQRARSG